MNKENITATKSKEMLASSLIELMEKKPYNSISITEITKNADLARRTFYRHFDTKEDVLKYYFSMFYEEYFNRMKAMAYDTCLDGLYTLLDICKENEKVLLNFKRDGLVYILLDEWTKIIPILYQKLKDKFVDFPKEVDENIADIIFTYNVGGSFNIVLKWINGDMKMPLEELKENIALVSMKILKQ